MKLVAALKMLVRTSVSGPMFLAACANEPDIEAVRLASRSSIRVDARIADGGQVNSGAVPRGQQAGAYAAGGASAGAAVWFQDPLTAAIAISAPVVILATGAAGAVAGGAIGAATGTSASQEEIDASVRVLSAAFRPENYERAFEETLAKAFEARLKAVSATCVETRRDRGKCKAGPARGDLHFRIGFQLAPPPTGGTSGVIDILGFVTAWADPRGLVEPNCISWQYRVRAGELISLASGGGAPLQTRMSQIIPQMARDLPYLLLPTGGAISSPRPELQENGSSPRRLSKAAFDNLALTRRGRKSIESGAYVLDETLASNEPRMLNSVEFRAMAATPRGKRLIESGFYVLDEDDVPDPPTRKRGRAPANQENVRSKWSRQHCDFSALSTMASR